MSGESLLVKMHRGLEHKYEIVLNFYKGKQINQILSMDSRYPVFMDFCDTRFFAEEFEYLKRVYYYKTSSGKPEIPQRMKMICEHYANSPTLSTFTYEYPMMVVTNTKSLFMRRKRRLRKIGVGEGSSDDTEEQEEEFNMFDQPTQYFLQNLDDSSLEEERSELESEVSYDSEPYDVFADDEGEPADQDVPKSALKLKAEEEDLKELIQDFGCAGQKQQQGSCQNSSSVGKTALTNIQNHSKTARDSVEITPIQSQTKLKFDKTERKQKKEGIFSQYVDMLLSKPISFSDLALRLNHPAVDEYTKLPTASQPQSIDNEREERANKRKKIREKAQELLKRVRNDEANSRPCPQ